MSTRRILLAYFGLFALSGAAGLVYEVLWLRHLAIVFGATAPATAAALGAFMGGLGAGGYFGGWLVSGHRNPLRLYALLELALIVAVGSVQVLLAAVDPLIGWAYRWGPAGTLLTCVRIAVPLLVLLGPTTLMGATLPVLASAIIRSPARISGAIGALYGWNTLGASAGAMLGGFVLIPAYGTLGTLCIAMTANAIVGISAWVLSTRAVDDTARARPVLGSSGTPADSRMPGLMLVACALSGLVALALEIIWSRTLVFFTGSTTYAFSLMIAVLLLGLAAGSFVTSWVGNRVQAVAPVIAAIFAGIALSALAGAYWLPTIGRHLNAWALLDLSWGRTLVVMCILAVTAIFVPAIGFGAALPLILRHEIVRRDGVAAATGTAYAANLAGSVAGAYLGGFVLVPLAGLVGSLRLLCAVLLGFGAVLAHSPSARRGTASAAASIALAVLAVVALAGRWHVPLHQVEAGEELVYYAEGASGTISVIRDHVGAKTLFIDHIGVAGTDPVMQTDQKSLAHLPMLLHPSPRRVLTVGFGSGGASWSYTRYPMLERIDCVEIAPEVAGAASYLKEANHDLFGDPRYHVIFDDARSLLAHTDERYDVIATDCTDLQYRGNAALYTLDYFGLCRRRLRPDGLVVVWMPLGGLNPDVFKIALNTFARSFPQVSVWYMNNYPTHYLLLVGSESRQRIDWERLLARLEIPEVRADLESVGLSDPYRLLSTFLMDDGAVRAFVAGSDVNSDARPLLEFRAPRSIDRFSGARNLEAMLDAVGGRGVAVPLATRYGEREERTVREKLAPYLRSAALLDRGHVAYQSARQDLRGTLELYRRAAAANPADVQIARLIDGVVETRQRLLRAYEAAAAAEPTSPMALHAFGVMLLDAGEAVRAAEVFGALARLQPESADVQVALARARREAGDRRGARSAIMRALQLDRTRADAWFERGVLDQQDADLTAAHDAFETALRIDASFYQARFNLGTVLAGMGQLSDARAAYEAGLADDPNEPGARINLAQILLLLGDRARAVEQLQRAAASNDPAAVRAKALLSDLQR
jgi:spermidine synthase